MKENKKELTEEQKLRKRRTEVTYFSDIKERKVEWLWYPYIPKAKLILVAGDPGAGKSTFTAQIASIVSTGGTFPFENDKTEQGIVMFQNGEDGKEDSLKAKLRIAGANDSNVFILNEDSENSKEDLSLFLGDGQRLKDLLRRHKPKLVIIDPIQQYIGRADMKSANHVRSILRLVIKYADMYDCTFIIVAHLNKGEFKAMYKVLGSVDFVAASRSVLMIGENPNNSEEMIIVHEKSSLAKKGETLAYKIGEDGAFNWLGKRGQQQLYEFGEKEEKIQPNKFAINFIKSELKNGDIEASIIIEKAKEFGISESTLKRAKEVLGVGSYQKNNKWFWTLKK